MIDFRNSNSYTRDSTARFIPGTKGGPGSPFARKVGQLRAALLETVTEDDMRAIAATLVAMARGGNLPAIQKLFERMLGKPIEADPMERLGALEALLMRDQGGGVAR
jgi:hypothetical protein